MSKTTGIDKKRLSSFIIYHLIVIWILGGCATNTSVDKGVTEIQTPPHIEHVKVAQSQSETVINVVDAEIQKLAAITESDNENATEEVIEKYARAEPRIILKPDKSEDNQIIGIDFTMLEQGQSRLTVTTNKEISYDLDRVDINTLSLNINESIIPELLLKKIDTSHFQSALNSVKPVFDKEKKKVSIGISLKEIVPFHIKQSDNRLTMDFGHTKIKRKEIAIVPLSLADTKIESLARVQNPIGGGNTPGRVKKNKYTGAPMYLDFIGEDVTNIFRMMNEISEENIIWDPAIKGMKVSMILKNVPWDEALELILRNNNLAKRYVGENIIWLTTKKKMAQILAEEDAETRKLEQRREAVAKRLEEEKKRAEDETPLITEYLPVDFATASEMKDIINLSSRGNLRINERTNTIIIIDTAKSIEEAKTIVSKADIPEKQIMIEASHPRKRIIGLLLQTKA